MFSTTSLALSAFVVFVLGSTSCGGATPPSEACVAWVRCVQARDQARGTSTDVERFVEGGACWTAAPEGAEACTTSCSRGLEVLRSIPDAPEVCQ